MSTKGRGRVRVTDFVAGSGDTLIVGTKDGRYVIALMNAQGIWEPLRRGVPVNHYATAYDIALANGKKVWYRNDSESDSKMRSCDSGKSPPFRR